MAAKTTKIKQSLQPAACSAALIDLNDALYVIGGKWSLRVIITLRVKNMRFNELQRSIPGISARVLSCTLKELEKNGFVKRNLFTDGPVVVEYENTRYSETLEGVLHALTVWGAMHRKTLQKKARPKKR